jgi:hypothetical protein
MNLWTGSRLLVPRPKGRSIDFQAFRRAVRRDYRGWHVALLLDEDSCHTARASRRAAEGMTLLWLPKRAPELNPMEALWGQGKEVVSANRQYEPIEDQVARFIGYVYRLSNQEALQTSGVLSANFWLRDVVSKNL